MRNPVNFIFYIVFIYQDCFGRPGRLLFSAILFYKDYGGSQADQGGCANQCGRIFLQALLKAGARTKTARQIVLVNLVHCFIKNYSVHRNTSLSVKYFFRRVRMRVRRTVMFFSLSPTASAISAQLS